MGSLVGQAWKQWAYPFCSYPINENQVPEGMENVVPGPAATSQQ